MTSEEARLLDQLGYVVLDNFMGSGLLDRVRDRIEAVYAQEGDQAGWEFKQEPGARRLANLVGKGVVFQEVVLEPRILEYVGHVIGDRFKLSSMNARSASPHSDSPQPLHADAAAIPDDRGNWVCNVLWMLDDFTQQNGALRVVPGSHTYRRLPQDALSDPSAPHPEEILITGPAGTVVVMNAHAWHGGTANRTSAQRRALHTFYARWDKPQQQFQKQLLSPRLQESMPPQLRELLALDDPFNDEVTIRDGYRSGFMK